MFRAVYHTLHDARRAESAKCHLQRIRQVIQTTGLMFLFTSTVLTTKSVHAFRVFDFNVAGLGIGRWDAAPHFVDGVERSLDGGIRYSVTGGSWEAFHNAMSWSGSPPTVEQFQHAVEQALAEWEVMDPATGLGTDLRFVPDFDTPVVSAWDLPLAGLNPGAEIDLMAVDHDGRFRSTSSGDPDADSVTLTSGVENYSAIVASGGDIEFSTNYNWTIDELRANLAFTFPFMLGIVPADTCCGDNRSDYYDDNYDGSSSETALATLTNSFADLIDPFDPDNSPGLSLYKNVCEPTGVFFDCAGDPGISTPGVDLLTEETPEAPAPGWKLQNDEFAARQFLYPFVRVPGDFDADKSLTVEDIDLLAAEINAEEPRLWFDLNDDGSVDQLDRDVWITDLQETFIGDANLDGRVDATDLNAVALSWRADDVTSWGQGDFNGDGIVNATDLNDLALNWRSGDAQAAAVPEPSSISLLWLVGLVTITCRRRLKAAVCTSCPAFPWFSRAAG